MASVLPSTPVSIDERVGAVLVRPPVRSWGNPGHRRQRAQEETKEQQQYSFDGTLFSSERMRWSVSESVTPSVTNGRCDGDSGIA